MHKIKTCHATASGVETFYERPRRKRLSTCQNVRAVSQKVYYDYDHERPSFETPQQARAHVPPIRSTRWMTPVQVNLYRVLMHGLRDFEAEEIHYLSPEERDSVERRSKRANAAVQKLKYEKYFGDVDKLFNAIWPTYKLGQRAHDIYSLPSEMTLKRLNVMSREVCDVLIKERLLPENFYLLQPTL